ncbi:MAG: hypothetical protein AB3N19_16155 [Ruegeria sp.]
MDTREPLKRLVLGEIFLLESGAPVPAAEVTVYDISDLRDVSQADAELTEKDLNLIRSGLSLGSSRTGADGSFDITFTERTEVTERNLVLVVTARRETAGAATRLLYLSPQVRRSAAIREEFAIGVPAALVAASVSAPGEAMRKAAASAYAASSANRTAVRDTLRNAVDTRRASIEESRNKVREALADRAKRRFTRADGKLAENYVPPDGSVASVQKAAMSKVLTRTGSIRMEAVIDPDDAGRKALVNAEGTAVAGLTSKQIREILYDRTRNPLGSDWAFFDALSLDCRKRRRLKSFQATAGGDGADSGGGAADGNAAAPATPDDVKRHLTDLLEEIQLVGTTAAQIETSGTLDGINGFVHGLDIKGGAADQTAIFDFETLNFAFDHVWQDIFDPWWSTILADRLIESGKFASLQAARVNGDGDNAPKRDVLEELAFQTDNIRAAASGEFGTNMPPTVSYSILGGIVDGIAAIGNLLQDATGVVYDTITGSGDGSANVRDHRDPDGGGVRDHRNRGHRRQRGRRMQVLNAYLKALDEVIAADYPFTVFGADESGRAINYGQVVKYRQHWEPKSYQAGELVKTLPLAPQQKVSFSSRRTIKSSYTEKRAEASENTYNSSDSATARDVAKIVNNAKLDTSYTLENKANASVPGVGGGESTSTLQTNFGLQSNRTKETFREQVRKESESFKNSASMHVETSDSEELLDEEKSEIQNPNDEIAFTCLFYELQRRFEVSEKLHKLTPVILVAEEVWKPSEITPERIGRFDWIIRRVLLDDSYAEALDIVSAGGLVAQQAGLADLEDLMEEQFDVVDTLRKQLDHGERVVTDRRRRRSRSLIEIGLEIVGLGGGQPNTPTESLLDEEEQERNETEDELRRQEGLLSQAVNRFNEAFTEYASQIIQVKKLQLHIKQNIIYYLQALWDHEDRHQMLMRLRHTQVPVITGDVIYSVSGSEPHEEPPNWNKPIRLIARARNFQVSDDTVDLAEVADLSRHLGFFGNYRIFPLTKMNPVSEILAVPFLSGRAGIHDPDPSSNITVGDLERYANCLRETQSSAEFQANLPKLVDTLRRRLDNARPDSEEIVIPTGSLFIELLPGTYSAMEHFKRQHRAVDVSDAMADVITKRLEHLRVAARIASDKLADPTTEKVIVADPDNVDIGSL